MLKQIFGIAPKIVADGSYSPSKLALKLATADKTDFENTSYSKYKGKKSKILVIFTEQKNMEMHIKSEPLTRESIQKDVN